MCMKGTFIQISRRNWTQWEDYSFEEQVWHFQQLLVMAQGPAGHKSMDVWTDYRNLQQAKHMNDQQIENEKTEKPGCHPLFSHRILPCTHLSHYNLPFPPAPARFPVCSLTQLWFLWETEFSGNPTWTAPGSALLAAEAVTPRAVPTPEAKRVGLGSQGHQGQLCPSAQHQQIFHAPRQGLQLVISPCTAIASGLLSDTWNLSWLLFLSVMARVDGGEKNKMSSEFSPPGKIKN